MRPRRGPLVPGTGTPDRALCVRCRRDDDHGRKWNRV